MQVVFTLDVLNDGLLVTVNAYVIQVMLKGIQAQLKGVSLPVLHLNIKAPNFRILQNYYIFVPRIEYRSR